MMRIVPALLLALACLSTTSAAETLSYADLVNRLVDLEALAVLPEPGEASAQWSSYHRASRYDTEADKYVEWDQNGDGHGIIRRENGTLVFAEMEGPGCIWRIWSARPMDGHVKIYLDGAPEPVVDLPFSGYFDRQNPPFTYPSLVYTASEGMNSYVPIPYQKSCKIVAEDRWGAFYHITYSRFLEGTTVPTFTTALSSQARDALERVDDFLSHRLGTNPSPAPRSEVTTMSALTLGPDASTVIAELQGERAITSLKVKIKTLFSYDEIASVLREVLLRITWDGDEMPAVWAPIGDFFGTTPGINHYRSLPLGMTEDTFYSYWYMPFAKSALVELLNEGRSTVSFEVSITHAPLSRPIEKLGRFHARWHRDAFLPAQPERAIDWTILKTEGRGRFCGVMLHVWNPNGGWWGEGDEKFFVDGEKFPSTFGTGSEDYFGYAWGDPALFQKPYHNQTFNRAANRGHVSVNRWHIADSIPFQSSFEGAIEKYPRENKPTIYAATAYWYLAPGGIDPYQAVPASERTGYYDYILPPIPKGRITFTSDLLHIAEVTGGKLRKIQKLHGPGRQRWKYLLWESAQPGDRLVFETLPLMDAGIYDVNVIFTRTPQTGVVQLYLDGSKIGEPIDTRSDQPEKSARLSLGKIQLGKGQHRISVEPVGPESGGFALESLILNWLPEQEQR